MTYAPYLLLALWIVAVSLAAWNRALDLDDDFADLEDDLDDEGDRG